MNGFWELFAPFLEPSQRVKNYANHFTKLYRVMQMWNLTHGSRMFLKSMGSKTWVMSTLSANHLQLQSRIWGHKITFRRYTVNSVWERWTKKRCWEWLLKWVKCNSSKTSKIISTLQGMKMRSIRSKRKNKTSMMKGWWMKNLTNQSVHKRKGPSWWT